MKKLALALILAVILTLILGVPVFAQGPDDMPEEGLAGLTKARPNIGFTRVGGYYVGYDHSGNLPMGPVVAMGQVYYALMQDCPPGQVTPGPQ